ncbi:MAG: hypothetical protein AAFR76_11530 [Planctomycetota bacterium]
MPPLPRFQIDDLAELASQLRFAPKSALVRDLERTEELAYELDASGSFPLDYIVFRVTGYRPEQSKDALIAGDALLGDLATLAEHLSAAAKIPLASLDGALSADELCEKWSVSRKTIERYRRRGLLSRRVVGPGGKPRVAYMPEAVAAFEAREPQKLRAATTFSRLEPEVRDRVIAEAREHAREGKSLNQAALSIAERIGRGHETVRQILQRWERDEGESLFDGSGPMGPRERRLCYLAWRRALEPGAVAERVGKPRASVLRVTVDERARVLRELLPVVSRGLHDEAPDETAVEHELATAGIGRGGPDLLEDLLSLARGIGPMTAAEERARLAACRELRRRAVRAIGELPDHGNSAPEIDRIETDLRWSARVKAELVRGLLPVMLRAIESRLGAAAEQLGSTALRAVIEAGLDALAESIDTVHPSDRGRLASPVSLAVDRATRPLLAAQVDAASLRSKSSDHPGRAKRKIGSSAAVRDFTRAVYRWQALLEPDARVRGVLDAVGDRNAAILRLRFGYAPVPGSRLDGRPATLAELAEVLDSKPLHTARSERAAMRRAMEAVRLETA